MDLQLKLKPIVTCELCGKKIMRAKLKKHLDRCRYKDGNRTFECKEPDCHKTFETEVKLTDHIRKVHSEPIKCPIPGCGDTMKRNSLSNHRKLVHERIKEECPNCGKKVAYGYLTIHLSLCTSDGSRPVKCEKEGCNSTFRTSLEKSIHIRVVHSSPIECPFPDCKTKMQKASLSQHVRRIHDGFKEQCPHCDKQLSYGHLSTHLKSCKKNGSRQYKCGKNGCKNIFRTARGRSIHIKRVHN